MGTRSKSRRDRVKGYVVGLDEVSGCFYWIVKVTEEGTPNHGQKCKVASFAPGVMLKRPGIDVTFSLNEDLEAISVLIGHWLDDIKKAKTHHDSMITWPAMADKSKLEEKRKRYEVWRDLCIKAMVSAKDLEELCSYRDSSPGTRDRDIHKVFHTKANGFIGGMIGRLQTSLDEMKANPRMFVDHKSFNPANDFGYGWVVIDEDEHSRKIEEFKIKDILLLGSNCQRSRPNGRGVPLERKDGTLIPLDAACFLSFWRNKQMIPEGWKSLLGGVNFEGTVICRIPTKFSYLQEFPLSRAVLNLHWQQEEARWGYRLVGIDKPASDQTSAFVPGHRERC